MNELKDKLRLILKYKPVIDFISIFFLAIYITSIPFISKPLLWLSSYFHEITHGLVAIASGGQISSIKFSLHKSFISYHGYGGNLFWITYSGYLGSLFWGMIIFMCGKKIGKLYNFMVLGVIIAVLAPTALYWSSGFSMIVIIGYILICSIICTSNQVSRSLPFIPKFIGAIILIPCLKEPFIAVFDGSKRYGDAASLEYLTGSPELLWALSWIISALLAIYFLWNVNESH